MKRQLFFIFIILPALFVMAGCNLPGKDNGTGRADTSGSGIPGAAVPEADPSLGNLKTFGDVYAAASDEYSESVLYDDTYILVFELNGMIYRAIGYVPDETAEAAEGIDVTTESYNDQLKALISPVEFEKIENLSAELPSEEELNNLAGRTGAYLLDNDWTCAGYNLDEMEFWMEKGYFVFRVNFDGTLEMTDDFDEYKAIRPLIIKSVVYDGIGSNATDIEYEGF